LAFLCKGDIQVTDCIEYWHLDDKREQLVPNLELAIPHNEQDEMVLKIEALF